MDSGGGSGAGPSWPLDEHLIESPARILERLRTISGYTWDDTRRPFHSTYDNWHVFGTRFVSPFSSPPTSVLSNLGSSRGSSADLRSHLHTTATAPTATTASAASTTSETGSVSDRSTNSVPMSAFNGTDVPVVEQRVVARVSYHVLREERAFYISKSLVASADTQEDRMVKPLDVLRLPAAAGDRGPVIVAVYEDPGPNSLAKLMDFGPAFYFAQRDSDRWEPLRKASPRLDPPITLESFLDFAIGAAQCLEIIHHGQGIVHGEIRGDAFHYNADTRKVRLISFGSGLRSFEHGLTSTAWSAFSKTVDAKHKLQYISPEQTGRMPAEPDTRTDIYSLGILLWVLLTRRPVYEGDTPLDIVQAVLTRKVPSVTTYRIDVPDVIGRIIQKCTEKNVTDRYHSAGGLRYDLTEVQKMLGSGNLAGLRDWPIGTRDVSSSFRLPAEMLGRDKEKAQLLRLIEKTAKSQSAGRTGAGPGGSSLLGRGSDGSSFGAAEMFDAGDVSSDGGSSTGRHTHSLNGSRTETKSRTSAPQLQQQQQQASGSLSDPLGPGPSVTLSSGASTLSAGGLHRLARGRDRHAFVADGSHNGETTQHSDLSRHGATITTETSGGGAGGGATGGLGGPGTSSSLARQLGSTAKFRRHGHCEIVLIEGSGGLGKSSLVQSVLPEVRRRGYCATAKFDKARKTPFGPLLKLMSSLFRQVQGERNTDTLFHQALRQNVRPVWPMLHKALGLPDFLLPPTTVVTTANAATSTVGTTTGTTTAESPTPFSAGGGGGGPGTARNSQQADPNRRGSTPESSTPSALRAASGSAAQNSREFLRAGVSTKTNRLLAIFLEVLRVFTQHKFICLCLDDLHYADDESLEMITQIVGVRLKLMLIITYRPEELPFATVQKLLTPVQQQQSSSSEGAPKGTSGGTHITRITLAPLTEEDIAQYVSTALSLPTEAVYPLALVIQSKTAGNPFYMREMLSAGHRKKCIWYDYLVGQWKYDLDRLFEQFQGEQDYDVLDTDFITRRLSELPKAARTILAWAALLGHTFSFDLICKLMSGQRYLHENTECPGEALVAASAERKDNREKKDNSSDASDTDTDTENDNSKPTENNAIIAGLQAAIQAFIIVPSDQDDHFRFAHDRYIQAALALKESSDRATMHFVIAQVLLNNAPDLPILKDNAASHVCESVDIIRAQVTHRRPYRKLLFERAHDATESGARPTAAQYLANAVALLQQPDPWDESAEDVYYEETLQLHLQAAECQLFMGLQSAADALLQKIFAHARTALDTAPAWVLQSRISAQSGDSRGALESLTRCLEALGVRLEEGLTEEGCDERFWGLVKRIRGLERGGVLDPVVDVLVKDTDTAVSSEEAGKESKTDKGGTNGDEREDSEAREAMLCSIGAVLAETTSAGWWTDNTVFYQLALLMVDTHFRQGAYPQSAMAFIYLSFIALSRFNDPSLACELSSFGLDLLDKSHDPCAMSRGYIIYANFVGHVQDPISLSVAQADGLVDFAMAAGDRISTILSFALSAQLKFYASEHYADVEAFCQFGCEEIPNWHLDTRGGTLLIAIRQVCRALQGKTQAVEIDRENDPDCVMSDEHHDTATYKQWLTTNTNNGGRSRLIYETMEMVPLFLFGHYDRAIEIGRACEADVALLWSARNGRLAMLFYGLALAGSVLRRQSDPSRVGQLPHQADRDEADQALVSATVAKVAALSQRIKDWEVVDNVNYLAWSRLLDASGAEMLGHHGTAIRLYEEALDHAAEQGFVFEEALGNYLMANVFIRNAARRSARSALREAVSLYRLLGANGVADRIEADHSILLQRDMRNPRNVDQAVQTEFATDAVVVTAGQYRATATDGGGRLNNTSPAAVAKLKGERMASWRGSTQRNSGGGVGIAAGGAAGGGGGSWNGHGNGHGHGMVGGFGTGGISLNVALSSLDVLDLHGLLESFQVISSHLQVDNLLKTMCEIILNACTGSATTAAIVVLDEAGNRTSASASTSGGSADWCVAASGDLEHGVQSHTPGLPLIGTDRVAENTVLYCMRTREDLLLQDVVADEQHGGNVSEAWLQRNPGSRAVIVKPILHEASSRQGRRLLGAVYLEGAPGSLTTRNDSVVGLLVVQLSISLANALAMKALKKASAENISMVAVQKRALEKAIAAETKAKTAEAEAIRNVKLAEDATKAKSIFLANVSHELRTPLNGVIGNSELLRDSNLNREQLEMADSIRVSADLLLTVINDILDFSRMEADKMKLYVIAFNPEEMVREVVRAVSYSNREKTSKKKVRIVQDIDLGPKPMLIYGDPIRLHQVLGNLIGNSLKFTEDGAITIGARVEEETDDSATLTFWVQDTGIGISPQQLENLFQPFSQADASTARKYGGSGLGLSICKSLIETMMQGTIRLESQVGVGTTARFTVTFDKPQPEVVAGDEQPSIPQPSLRICIAEDNAINARIALQYLQRLGYPHVDTYDNGQRAVEGLREKARQGVPYHIILMDVQMPILDGYEATRLLRRDEDEEVRKVLVIAMTASAIQGDREKCLAAGMDDYLAKPVRSETLKKKLDSGGRIWSRRWICRRVWI
ncbi:uncharacterized protein C8A04DRAFT_37883 [Dichotomopilus funicola]|uniref:histidine kinase n=1 Tax=Dichotomopilus funicola TaxID=1934379 RepID=A0AAN6V1A3_9PEZI|nr:hypothetical protein C8A04DRAFT_37883 [Dichotomopilus funicola]